MYFAYFITEEITVILEEGVLLKNSFDSELRGSQRCMPWLHFIITITLRYFPVEMGRLSGSKPEQEATEGMTKFHLI